MSHREGLGHLLGQRDNLVTGKNIIRILGGDHWASRIGRSVDDVRQIIGERLIGGRSSSNNGKGRGKGD